MSINQRFKILRKSKKLSQKAFSEIFNVKQATISQIESSKIMPSLDMIIKITYKYREINIMWLLTGNGEMINKYSTDQLEMVINEPEIKYGKEDDLITKLERQLDRQEREINRLLKYIEIQDKFSHKK